MAGTRAPFSRRDHTAFAAVELDADRDTLGRDAEAEDVVASDGLERGRRGRSFPAVIRSARGYWARCPVLGRD